MSLNVTTTIITLLMQEVWLFDQRDGEVIVALILPAPKPIMAEIPRQAEICYLG